MTKVDLFVFSYRNGPSSARDAISVMKNYAIQNGVDVLHRDYGNALIHRARNTALAAAREDVDYVLFVDDDMVAPTESIPRMLAHEAPIVSALCTTRVPPVELAAKVYDPRRDGFFPLDKHAAGAIYNHVVEGNFAVGTAFVMLHRSVVESLREQFLSAADWMQDNRRRLDRMHVRAENREKERRRIEEIRRANWANEKHLRVFDYIITEDELQLGEDITFGRRVHSLKIPVTIDGTLVVGHIGEYPYSVHDVLTRLDAEEMEAA